jgi:hypothetical protein
MCTVSIVPYDAGFRVMSNRDECRDRAIALEPRMESLACRSAIMPIDPVGGGSWIGVNDRGLLAALLNRSPERFAVNPHGNAGSAVQVSRDLTSRGAIVRQALACDSVDAALESTRSLDAMRFRPFRLIVAQKDRIALVAGDGRELVRAQSVLAHPCMFTASSLGDLLVDTPRRRLFECLMHPANDRRSAQSLFHHHQWADKRDISVLMERDDAATVSRTTVDVYQSGIVLEYESLLPPRPVQRLELQPC